MSKPLIGFGGGATGAIGYAKWAAVSRCAEVVADVGLYGKQAENMLPHRGDVGFFCYGLTLQEALVASGIAVLWIAGAFWQDILGLVWEGLSSRDK